MEDSKDSSYSPRSKQNKLHKLVNKEPNNSDFILNIMKSSEEGRKDRRRTTYVMTEKVIVSHQ